MTETANILNNATARASSSWTRSAAAPAPTTASRSPGPWRRDIAQRVRAFTLFATHYFELTTLAAEVEGCANVHLDATEHADGIVFLHAVKDGPADRSYGLQVAQLARRPAPGDRRGAALPGGARGRARQATRRLGRRAERAAALRARECAASR